MTEQNGRKNRHLILEGFAEAEPFRSIQQWGSSKTVPERNRHTHGSALLGQVDELKSELETARQVQEEAGLESGFGLKVEFEGFPDVPLAFESLAREQQGIELLNVREEGQRTNATVLVPDGKLEHFEGLIRAYLEERRDRAGNPRDNKKLLNAVKEIRAASLRSLWTDREEVFPVSDDETFWWEVWLPIRGDRSATVANFRRLAEAQEFRVASGELEFPERTVLLVYASAGQMKRSITTLNSIAELRRAKETAEFFDSLLPEEQPEWLDDLLERTQFAETGEAVPHVCLLDTGVNNGHPLIAPQLAGPDLHTVEPAWGTDDAVGHGTLMAGLALAGDLTEAIASGKPVEIGHRLESVKLLDQDASTSVDPQHHGYLTAEAVARPEITAPQRQRVFSMAVTARDNRDRGRPSAWSAAVDRLAVDAEGEGATPRLLVVSAGNTDPNAWVNYHHSNSSDGIHDPGQAWNALTVGACTDLVHITEQGASGYQPIASRGGLSPFSTTSSTWQQHWPLKPDVVFEGGNAAISNGFSSQMPSLSLLTSHHRPNDRLLTTVNATSAAAALAARMGGQIMAAYPSFWPESVRALIVHSAEWTPDMRRMFLPRGDQSNKNDYGNLVRHCGFGEPDLERALWSASNSLTMVLEEQLHPFMREGSKDPKLRDMNLHRLPWPLEELESLGETQVEMRVTLSYFVEPNPSERGFRSRYRYESHGLRFDVKRQYESEQDFRARINATARDEEAGTRSRGNDQDWLIGTQNRHRGSLHSDIWRGSAADLASRGTLAVYPALGWWKTRPRQERYDKAARYALIVSIRAPEVDVDLYTAVANQIATSVPVDL
jgi:hypothetical protein